MARETDDVKKRKKIAEERFGGKKTIKDDYTSKRIQKNKSNVDHVTPIDEVDRRYSNYSPEERKRIANTEKNLAITNEKINKSKGNLTNSEYIDRELKKGKKISVETAGNMLEKQYESEKAIKKEAKKIKAEKVLGFFKK